VATDHGEGAPADGKVRLTPGTAAASPCPSPADLAAILIPIGLVAIGICRERAQPALRERRSAAAVRLGRKCASGRHSRTSSRRGGRRRRTMQRLPAH
jgi:hypothetical protein